MWLIGHVKFDGRLGKQLSILRRRWRRNIRRTRME
jgi:hypothetical protein